MGLLNETQEYTNRGEQNTLQMEEEGGGGGREKTSPRPAPPRAWLCFVSPLFAALFRSSLLRKKRIPCTEPRIKKNKTKKK